MLKKYSAYKNRNCIFAIRKNWRVVRVVEGARLESVYMGNCIKSSNLLLSAIKKSKPTMDKGLLFYFGQWVQK